jgi:hypothetical protein
MRIVKKKHIVKAELRLLDYQQALMKTPVCLQAILVVELMSRQNLKMLKMNSVRWEKISTLI